MKEYIVHAPKDNPCAIEEYTTFYGEPIEELVRCKDCSAYKAFREGGFHHYCALSCRIVNEEDFCSNAERKEE